MKIDEAAALIHIPLVERDRPQSWCDLGSGRGIFTRALAQHLAPGSTVYAVDFDASALEGIPDRYKDVEIRKIVGDVESLTLRLPASDGVLMANMLHFVREQQSLLRRLLIVTDRFLVVEYERIRPHRWGPYPVGFDKLCQTFPRDRSRGRREAGDAPVTVWRHDILGPRLEISRPEALP